MIWWCLEHEVGEAEPRDVMFPDGCIHEMEWSAADPKNCRMVEALLIVKENGEWPVWALSVVRPSCHPGVLDALAEVAGEEYR